MIAKDRGAQSVVPETPLRKFPDQWAAYFAEIATQYAEVGNVTGAEQLGNEDGLPQDPDIPIVRLRRFTVTGNL